MNPVGILLCGFLVLVVGVGIASAIISAAPAIAVVLTAWIILKLACSWYDAGEDQDDDKPP